MDEEEFFKRLGALIRRAWASIVDAWNTGA